MLRTINNLIKGNKMSDTFSNHWAIPEIASFMIQTGESTGELAEMLDKVADYYQKEEVHHYYQRVPNSFCKKNL